MSMDKLTAQIRAGRILPFALEDFHEPERLHMAWKAECEEDFIGRDGIRLFYEDFVTGSDDDFMEPPVD